MAKIQNSLVELEREKLLKTVARVAEILLTSSSNVEANKEALMSGMELVGLCLDVDRVQVWNNEMHNGELHFVMRYEWLSEYGKKMVEVPIGLKFPYSSKPHWLEKFMRGEAINAPLSAMPMEDKDILIYYEMKSIVILPLFRDEKFIGFFSIDDGRRERKFTTNEMSMLASTGLMFASYFNDISQRSEIENRDNLLFTINNMTARFLRSDTGSFKKDLWESMGMIGEALKVDRVFIFKNYTKDNKLYCTQIYEWSGGAEPTIDNEITMDTSYSDFVPDLEKLLSSDQCLNGIVRNLSEDVQAVLTPQGILSILLVPVFLYEKFWGFIGLDDCHNERIFTANEEMAMRSASLAMVSALVRYEQILQIRSHEEMEHQLLEASEAKSKFLARMSHEIRTPISAVLGISEIELQNRNLPPHVEESFAKIHNSANTLLGIVNDILDLSKIEAGKMEIVENEYATASMIGDAAHLHFNFTGSKAITFIIKVDENLPAALVGDSLRIVQIMNNLLSNAFKYTESGSITLSVNWNNGSLVISIKDTGMGMTKEQLNALHHEYTRFHEQKMPSVVGTGLGMPIVHSMVQMMGGSINLESKVGEGTSVTVCIPQKKASEEVLGKDLALRLEQFGESPHTADKKFNFTPEPMPYGNVLVVDDVDANLYVARGLLAFYDLNIETCDSGYKAIEKIKQGKIYDIIFMDQMMPGLNGDETLRIMREMGYTQPVVALTANAMIGYAEELIKYGFDGFISKPIQTAHLNAILNKHVRDKQPPEVIEAAKIQKQANQTSRSSSGSIEEFQNSPDSVNKLRRDFAKNHKDNFIQLSKALAEGDAATAHRLAHTLKGLAKLIKEDALAELAKVAEEVLRNGGTPSGGQLSALEKEFTQVLKSIDMPEAAPLPGNRDFDKEKAAALFDRLAPLLETNSYEAQSLLDELCEIPETVIIAKQIEEFDFAAALQNLKTLKGTLGL